MATLLNYSAVNTTAGIFADNAEKQRAAALAYSAVTATANEETEYNMIFAGLTATESQLQLKSNTLGINPVFAEMSNLNTVGDDIKINIAGDQADETAAALRVLMRSSPTAKRLLSIVAEEAEASGGVFTIKTDDALASAGTVVSGLYRTSDPNSIYLNSSNRKNVLDMMMTIVHEAGHALGPTLMDHGADHDLISKAVAAELAANAGITGGEKEIVTFNAKAVTAGEVVAPAASTFLPPPPPAPAPVVTLPVAPTTGTAGAGSMANYVTGMQQLTANNVAVASAGMNSALNMSNINYPMPTMDTEWLNSFMTQMSGGMNTGTTTMPSMVTTAPSIYDMDSIFDTSKMLNMSMFAIPMQEISPMPYNTGMGTGTTPPTTTGTPPATTGTPPVATGTPPVATGTPVTPTGGVTNPEITSVFAGVADDGHGHTH